MDGFERAVDLVHDHGRKLSGDYEFLIVTENVLGFLRWIKRECDWPARGLPPRQTLGRMPLADINYPEGSASAGQFLELRHGRFFVERRTRYVWYET